MGLGETFIFCSHEGLFFFFFFLMKGYFYVGSSLCSLQKSNIFSASAVFNMDICHVFPQCVLAIIPLIGGVTGVVMTVGCSAGPPLCCVVITALSAAGFSPQFGG